jgi:hypothetical protein
MNYDWGDISDLNIYVSYFYGFNRPHGYAYWRVALCEVECVDEE